MLDWLIAAALAQAAAPPPAAAPDPCYAAAEPETQRPGCPAWRLLTRDERGARYFDPASGVRHGDDIDVMTRTILPAPAEGVTVWRARMRLFCPQHTWAVMHATGYSDTGAQISDLDYSNPPQPAEPGHDIATMMTRICPAQPAPGGRP